MKGHQSHKFFKRNIHKSYCIVFNRASIHSYELELFDKYSNRIFWKHEASIKVILYRNIDLPFATISSPIVYKITSRFVQPWAAAIYTTRLWKQSDLAFETNREQDWFVSFLTWRYYLQNISIYLLLIRCQIVHDRQMINRLKLER